MEKGRIDLSTYVDVLWRRKWPAIAILVLTVASAAFYTSRIVPIYRATTTMIVDTSSEAALLDPRSFFWFWQPSETAKHAEILTSRSLARVVARNMPEGLRSKLPGVDEEGMASIVQSSTHIETDKNSDMIRVSVRARDRTVAAELANLIAETYRNYNLTQRRAAVTAMREFIEEQLTVAENRLNAAEEALQQFKESQAIVSLRTQIGSRIENQANFETAYQQARIERESLEKRLAYLNDQIEGEGSGLAAQLDDVSSPVIESIKNTLTELEVERANLMLQGLSDDSPKVKAIDSQIVQAKENLKKEAALFIPSQDGVNPMGRLETLLESAFSLNVDLEGQRAKENALKEVVDRYDRALKVLPSQERTMARLTLDSDVNQKIYMLLSEKREEARIQEAGKLPIIRIIDEARPPYSPIEPKKKRNLAMGFMLGLLLSVGACFGLEYLDTSIKSPADLEMISDASTLATIPDLNQKGIVPLRRKVDLGNLMLTRMPAKSRGADAFRVLRTNLQYVSVDKPIGALLVTSPTVGEGKSLVSMNLAIALAQMGSKTLVVDADLRRPVLHKAFGVRKEPGLTELIVDKGELNEIVRRTDVENLYCLSCGSIPPNSADLLNSKAAEKVYGELADEFDFVIYDSAPVLAAADTPILATKIEDVILVTKARLTSKPALEGALKTLAGLKANLLGIVLNGLERGPRHGRYYYYYYHDKY